MPNPPQPWYTPGSPQQPVPGNPYASEGFGPPSGPPPRRRRFGGAPVIAAVVAMLLVAAGGGVYALVDRGEDGPTTPVAKDSSSPSAPTAPPTSPAVSTPQAKHIPTTEEINAARKPGDAATWIVDDKTDLPSGHQKVYDLWIVGDTVVQAMYRKVAAYRLSDGVEVWSMRLPAPVCETPANPTPDGKVVLVHNKRADTGRNNRCNQLQMIDLKTGKPGWHKELPETGDGDNTFIVHSAISAGTFAIARSMKATAYRVDDGTELFDIPWEDPGKCFPADVAGGSRLLVSSDCMIDIDQSKNHSQLREIDPLTGKVLWRHRTKTGWKFGSMISVDPVVFTTENAVDRIDDWRVVALGPGGKPGTTIDPRGKSIQRCAGYGSGGDIQPCRGTAVGNGLIVLGGNDRIRLYDLATGKFLWGVKNNELRTLHPLRAEKGKAVLVYESATPSRPGRTFLMGPGAAGTEKVVLRHPASTATQEYEMSGGRLAYAGGRVVLTSASVSGDDDRREARMLSFAPGPP
ncbi:PQQ-binding-like beta-propeller repeat protein [Streptomyces sp. NPDC059499]|uniref:outer membrane protein assembly factor BamB family protein n=1 Tax=Streptomyces sp. NPDC059499 TaxID=3346852 RepID=UPI003677C7E8